MRSHVKAPSAGTTMRCAKDARSALFGIAAALLLSAAFAAPAQAAPPETIAEFGNGAGEVNAPNGVAVDRSSGEFYVAEGNGFRISKFDASGNFLMAWGYGVRDGATLELQTCGPAATPPSAKCFGQVYAGNTPPDAVYARTIAVDSSSGAVYIADEIRHRISKYTSSGQFVFIVGRNVNVTKVGEGGATQAEKNLCTAASGDTCEANFESGTGPNEFASPSSLAVDSSGTVWVGSTDRLSSFDSAGAPGAEIALPGAGGILSHALDSAGNFFVVSQSLPGVRKLEAGTGALLETVDAAGFPQAVTLDEADNLYVGDCGTAVFNCPSYHFKVYDPSGAQTYQFGTGQVIGGPEGNSLAVGDAAERLYTASSRTDQASAVQAFPLPEPGPLPENQHVEDLEPTAVTLAADLNPEGDQTTYHFEWGTTASYGQSTPSQVLPGEGFDPEAVEADLEELTPDTTYHFRLCASNAAGSTCGPDTTFTTLPAIDIQTQWATDITATSAVLRAEMDPLGVEAQWWIEYGTSTSYGQSTAENVLPATFEEIAVATQLLNLTPGTTYHYRFAARDERDGTVYSVHGPDKTFTTQVSGLGFELADDRAWEMVSPPNKYGALIHAPGEGQVQAAVDGSALTYLSLVSIEPEPEGTRAIEQSSVLARRDGAGGWSSKDITPPQTTPTPFALGAGREYRLFSPNLERALFEPRDPTPHSPQATERTAYLRENTEPATYTPLVTGKEGFANVPPGTEFGGDPKGFNGNVHVAGATPDLSHVVLESQVPLAVGAANSSLYEWEAGQLHEVSVLPASQGSATVSAQLGSGSTSVRKAISDDGSRIFWSTGGGTPNGLYLRDMDREETVRLDVVQPGSFGIGAPNPVFEGANAEGTIALFTDSHQLTADANEKGRDLYRCEVTVEEGELNCDLTNLTAATAGVKESAEVQGIASGMSDDATRIYFVAKGVLDSAPNGHGDGAVAGQFNLYRWQEGSGIRFIAGLAEEDGPDWAVTPGGGVSNNLATSLAATASPSGRYLAFMSQRSLTGYENRDARTDELLQEVFRYDALADELICASCNPSGASPVGVTYEATFPLFDPQLLWGGRPLAAVLPEATATSLNGPSFYRTRAVHDNGRLFFNAADSLVAADSNGTWDVYQYEPSGTGDCTASSGGAATSRSAGGCVSLISSGTAQEESAFLDASVGGEDVFFYTPAQLSVTDEDEEVDVYDARVNGIPAKLTPNAECLGEACQPAARVPNDPTPASAAFRGAGNQGAEKASKRRCAKGKRKITSKGKSRCVSRKQRRRASKAKRARRAAAKHGRASR